MKKALLFFTGMGLATGLWAQNQNVGIGTTTPDASAALEIKSTDQGLLIPRMDSTARKGILNPAEGLLVFDTNQSSFYYFNGTDWQNLNGTDVQLLTLSGDTLQIGNGNYVVLQDEVNDADSDPANELQNLNLNGDTLSLSQGNYILLPSGTINTDNQTLSLNGDTLFIEDGNFVLVPRPALNVNNGLLASDDCFDSTFSDASYDIDNLGSYTTSASWQSFTALDSGLLTQVSLHNGGNNVLDGGYLKIYAGQGASGALLYTAVLGTTMLNGWNDFQIAGSVVAIDSGAKYTIYLEDTTGGNFGWTHADYEDYPGGRASHNDDDLWFRVYLNRCRAIYNITPADSLGGTRLRYIQSVHFTNGNTFDGSVVQDSDGDTRIETERNADDDIIRFSVRGLDVFTISKNPYGHTLMQPINSPLPGGLIIGETTHFGLEAGESTTTGIYNSFFGYLSGSANTSGRDNTGMGSFTLKSTTSGEGNTALGSRAGMFNSTGNNNVFLGYEAGYHEVGSNKLYIENSDTVAPLIYGEFDNDLVRINGDLEVTGSFPGSDDQTLFLNGDTLSIQNGNSVVLPNNVANGLAFAPAACDSSGTLDQVNNDLQGIAQLNNSRWQSFQPSFSGFLTLLSVRFALEGFSGGTLTIYAGEGTGGAIIYQDTNVADVGGNGFKSFPIPYGAAPLNKNATYTWRLQEDNGQFRLLLNTLYPRGRSDFGSSEDWIFRTFMARDCSDGQIISPPTPFGTVNFANIDTLYFSDGSFQVSAPTDDQTLSLNGDTLSIQDGNSVVFQDDVDDADNDPTNELQNLILSGDTLQIVNGNSVVLPAQDTLSLISDADGDTKIQVEESTDEDIIRFDLAGSEYFRFKPGIIEFSNTANNIGLGEYSLHNVATGIENIALGGTAISLLTTGSQNVAVGNAAGGLLESGSRNVFVGHGSGYYTDISGNNNVCIGWQAGYSAQFGSGNIFIGSEAGPISGGESNQLYIDNQSNNTPLIYGEFDNDLVRINGDLEVTGSFPGSDVLTDADGDTRIQVEESADEDIIRFDVGGFERFQMKADGLNITTINNDAYLNFSDGGNTNSIISIYPGISVPPPGPGQYTMDFEVYGNQVLSLQGDGVVHVSSKLNVTDDANVGGELSVTDDASVGGELSVTGDANVAGEINTTSGLTVGSAGTTLSSIIKRTNSVNVGNVSSNSVEHITTTVTGAQVGATVFVSPSNQLAGSCFIGYARVSATNTVEITILNEGSNGQNLGTMDFYITVIN